MLPTLDGDYLIAIKHSMCDKLLYSMATFYKGKFMYEAGSGPASSKITHWMCIPTIASAPLYPQLSKQSKPNDIVELYKFYPDIIEESPYSIPPEWNCKSKSDNMDEMINCAECGKLIRYGESFSSSLIHDKNGECYCICSDCVFDEL